MQQMQHLLHRAQPYREIRNALLINILRQSISENATNAARKKCCIVALQGLETADLKLDGRAVAGAARCRMEMSPNVTGCQ